MSSDHFFRHVLEVHMTLFDLGYKSHEFASRLPGYRGTSLQQLFHAFPTEEHVFEHVMRVRFGDDPKCPRCGKHGRWQRHEVQKHFFHPCGGIISPMADCVFDRTRVPLQLWLYAFLHFANSSQGISRPSLARELGISGPTAHRMGSRIRMHLAAIDEQLRLGSRTDPVFVRVLKVRKVSNPKSRSPHTARVVALADDSRVHTTVIAKPSRSDLRSIIATRTDGRTPLLTDCHETYRVFSSYGIARPLVERTSTYFLENPGKVDRIHGFFSYFWNSFADQYRTVTRREFWKYLKEYEFRYNRRQASHETFWEMVSSFPRLTAKDIERLGKKNGRINLPEADI